MAQPPGPPATTVTPAAALRTLITQPGLAVGPGAWDGITARLVEEAGFPFVYMTGAGTAAARGYPDYGLLTLTEMADNAGVIARTVDLPVLADADTGYGNELNVTRTAQEYERRGVAGIHLEDQVSPKRCGHLEGKDVIEADRYLSLIRAAVAARSGDDGLVIVARTDAAATRGLDEAIDRANAALDAGADAVFVEAPPTEADASAIPERVHGPCLLNVVPGGKTPVMDLNRAEEMGYRVAICPALLLGSTAVAGNMVLTDLANKRVHPSGSGGWGSPAEFFALFGAAGWDGIREQA